MDGFSQAGAEKWAELSGAELAIAGLIASGRMSMLKAHLGIAHRLGIPDAQIKEVMIHS